MERKERWQPIPRSLPIHDISKDRGETDPARDVIEHREILYEITCEDASEYTAFERVEHCRAEEREESYSKNGKVGEESEHAARYQPIKNAIVYAVKPLLLPIHARVVVFVEDHRIILLTPAKDRPLLHTLPSCAHIDESGFGRRIIQRNG